MAKSWLRGEARYEKRSNALYNAITSSVKPAVKRRPAHGCLPRQPLRFLLADDPGAGKTIMAELLIKKSGGAEACALSEQRGEVDDLAHRWSGFRRN